MVSNRLTRLKGRLSSVIDWRVREAYQDERRIVADIAESMSRYSASFTDQINELNRKVEQLESRLREIDGQR